MRQLGKVTALGVLCCFALFVCLTLLASFFLPSHLSFKNMYIHERVYANMYMYMCFKCMHVHVGVLCCFALFVCLILLASFFLPSHLSFKNMYILGLVFGVIGGFITPAFSFILS